MSPGKGNKAGGKWEKTNCVKDGGNTHTNQESAKAKAIPPYSCFTGRTIVAGHAGARKIGRSRIRTNTRSRRKTADARRRALNDAVKGCLLLSAFSFIYISILLCLGIMKAVCSIAISRLGLRGGGPCSQQRHLLPTPADGGQGKSHNSKDTKTKEEKKRPFFCG